jgi:hypothetical protein
MAGVAVDDEICRITLRGMSVPFVGRKRELDELGGLIHRSSRARAPASAVVTGVPGSGKTRLLAEIMARPTDARRVRVVGFEPNQAVPLAAVGDVIRQLATVPIHGPRPEGWASITVASEPGWVTYYLVTAL